MTYWQLIESLKTGNATRVFGRLIASERGDIGANLSCSLLSVVGLEREDGSGKCWNVTGYTTAFVPEKVTVFVRTDD